MTIKLILEQAGDWFDHTNEQRLTHCADALYLHGLIKKDQHRALLAQINAQAASARIDRAKGYGRG